ncbi:putative cytochrome P450 4aa1 [Haematobia irritans]|uniref:putative cytochrome P450 4aa1 n=1 Tax=Haematobia irritans TaxID=7368 RepID=UPI003F4FA210
MFVQKVFEKASQSGLWSFVSISLMMLALYTLRDYMRAVLLSLKLSGPAAIPIMGNCMLAKDKNVMTHLAARAYDLYGSLSRIWVLLFPFFAVIHPDDLQLILSSKKHTSKPFVYSFMHNFLGKGLITNSGDKWHSHRRLIQPTFHLSILEHFIGTFADASQALYEMLDPLVGQDINITNYVNNCVVDILNEAVLGVPIKKNKLDMEVSPFRKGQLVIPDRMVKPWLLIDSIYRMTKMASEEMNQKRSLNDFTRKMIKVRREMKNNNEIQNKCLLDYMIEISDGNPTEFTEEDIVDEACTFMLAGQDSVGASVAFTMFLLAQNLECQTRCEEEIERIFGDDNRPPNMQDLREMRYLERCIKESLRLYPSVPLIARKLGEEVQLSKCTLPAGSNVFICPYATHRLKDIYPDPEKFDPERFSPENADKRNPYAFLAFSAGPRYCIGNRFAIMEMKTVISRLLRSYHILPVAGKTSFLPTFRITLRASGGLWLRLKPREHKLTELSS